MTQTHPLSVGHNKMQQPIDGRTEPVDALGTRFQPSTETADIDLPAGETPLHDGTGNRTVAAGATTLVGPLLEGQVYDFTFFLASDLVDGVVGSNVYYRATSDAAATIDTAEDAIWPASNPAYQRMERIAIRKDEPYYIFELPATGADLVLVVQRRL